MIKDLLQSKTKSYKKPWPENCAWPEPKFYGVKYDENLDWRGHCSPANYMRKIPIMKRKTPLFNMRYCPNDNRSEINERKN